MLSSDFIEILKFSLLIVNAFGLSLFQVKSLAEDKKASTDSVKQRFNVAMKEKSQYEQIYHKAKDDLEKKV